MTIWKALKKFSYTGLAGPISVATWAVQQVVGKDKIPDWLNRALAVPASHPRTSLALAAGWLILCAAVWLWADFREKVQTLVNTLPLFIRNKELQAKHFELAGFYDFYFETQEYNEAHDLLLSKLRLLVLGRPAGGKTRMAFQLAKECEGHWVIRVTPEFDKWNDIELPHWPPLYRMKVLWFIDDLDKSVGKSSVSWGERALGQQCNLRLLATCRKGQELDQARSDPAMRAFVESLPQVECRDLTQDELLTLAQKTGHQQQLGLYDGTPGSVTLGLEAMHKRLASAAEVARQTMRAIFLLRQMLIYSPRFELVQATVASVYDANLTALKFQEAVEWLESNGFLRRASPELVPQHDVYLTLKFFPYYAEDDPSLSLHIKKATETVEYYGSGEDLASLGTAVYQKGRLDEAIQAFRRALQLRPDQPDTLNNLGIALRQKGQLDEAIQAYHQALKLRPDFAQTHYNLGIALQLSGRNKEADQAFGKAEQLDPILGRPKAEG